MFDLKAALKNWREGFAKSESIKQSDLEELQAHIIDSIDQLKKQSLNEDEAFLVAVHRVGGADTLETEFRKAHPDRIWQNRFFWMLTGILTLLSFEVILGVVSKLALFLSSFFSTNFSLLYGIEMSVSVIVFLLLARFLYRRIHISESSGNIPFSGHFKSIHYIISAVLITVGQLLPKYLQHLTAKVHHESYWQVWSEYGEYLSDIAITNVIINLIFPLFLLITLMVQNRVANNLALNE